VPAPRWTVIEHRGPHGLGLVEADWRRLFAEMPNPSVWHSFEANQLYVEHLCPSPAKFMLLALSDGERVRAIMPLEERTDSALGVGLRVWGTPHQDAWRLADAIGPEDDARRVLLPAVLEFLRRQPGRPSLLVVGRTSGGTVLWDGLGDLEARDQYAFADGAAYVIATDVSVESFLKGLSSRSRKHISSADAAFNSLPDSHYAIGREPDELAEEFEQFLRVEASGWKGREGTAVKLNPKLEAFYRGLTTRMVKDGRCEIHALHAEGRCIAAEFCVYTGRQCAGLKSGYDEAYSRMTPGRLVVQKTLEGCCEDPSVDFVNEVSSAEWLRMWHPDSDDLRKAYVAIRPLSGRALLLALRFRFGALRRAVRELSAWRSARPGRKKQDGGVRV
jgi:CelD/BcsL family acetyltransferase involved in cellulose biosynthesis